MAVESPLPCAKLSLEIGVPAGTRWKASPYKYPPKALIDQVLSSGSPLSSLL